jgi:hypothetical protein
MFEEVYPLVLEGDATGMAAKVAELAETLQATKTGGASGRRSSNGRVPKEPEKEPGGEGGTAPPVDHDGAERRGPGIARPAAPVTAAVEQADPPYEAPEPLVHSPHS